jgi:uncharacterized protein
VALAHDVHPHHEIALAFFSEIELPAYLATFYLSRLTQMSLLRLLTNRSALGADVLTLRQAWQAYDRFAEAWKATVLDEPQGFEGFLRQHTRRDEASPQMWADGYVVAFAAATGLRLVTFDKALAKLDPGSILLKIRGETIL